MSREQANRVREPFESGEPPLADEEEGSADGYSACAVPGRSRASPSSARLASSGERFQAPRPPPLHAPRVLPRNRPCRCELASLEDSRSKPPGDSRLERNRQLSKRRRPAISSYARQRPRRGQG